MKKRIARVLRAIALWLDPPVEDPMVSLARHAVQTAEDRQFHPRLAKTHKLRSLMRLLAAEKEMNKLIPLARTRNIRYAIEQVMQERP